MFGPGKVQAQRKRYTIAKYNHSYPQIHVTNTVKSWRIRLDNNNRYIYAKYLQLGGWNVYGKKYRLVLRSRRTNTRIFLPITTMHLILLVGACQTLYILSDAQTFPSSTVLTTWSCERRLRRASPPFHSVACVCGQLQPSLAQPGSYQSSSAVVNRSFSPLRGSKDERYLRKNISWWRKCPATG